MQDDVKLILGAAKANEFQDFYNEARKVWDEQAKSLKELLDQALAPLKEYGVIIHYENVRVKEFDSLIRSAFANYSGQPIDRVHDGFEWQTVLRLGDIIGARFVCLNLSDVIKTVRRILSVEQFEWKRGKIKNYYERARASHYRTWQVQLKWRPDGAESQPVWLEIQVRTVLEDGWAEWEHELFYKRRPDLSLAAWNSLKQLYDGEKKEISDSLYKTARSLDRIREMFELASNPVPQHITRFLNTYSGHGLTPRLRDFFQDVDGPFRINVDAANLVHGLREEQVRVNWNDRFVGLQLQPRSDSKADLESAQRFAFDDLDQMKKEELAPTTCIQLRIDLEGFVPRSCEAPQ